MSGVFNEFVYARPSELEGLPALWNHLELLAYSSLIVSPTSAFSPYMWIVYGLIVSQRLKVSLCRFLDLFLCQAPNSPVSPVFCPTNSNPFSVPQLLFLSPQLSETVMSNFQEVPLPALSYGKCCLKKELHSLVWFSSLVDHSPGLPIVPVSEKTVFYILLVVYGERVWSVLLYYGRSRMVSVFNRSIYYCSLDFG